MTSTPSSLPASGRSTPLLQMDPATTPRILCFHGGGTSGQIFQIQTVRVARLLAPHFRLEFLDGPFIAPPGPGVHPFFEGMGPYFRWARRGPQDDGDMLRRRLKAKLAEPGGEWVGVLGFSQGSAMAIGLLLEQERGARRARGEPEKEVDEGKPWLGDLLPGDKHTNFRFGVICHGSYPPLRLSSGTTEEPEGTEKPWDERMEGLLGIPTIHVQGLRDFVLPRSRLLTKVCKKDTANLLEFDIEHRMPIVSEENERIKRAIFSLWNEIQGEDGAL